MHPRQNSIQDLLRTRPQPHRIPFSN
jgi:serine/threonine protein kinase